MTLQFDEDVVIAKLSDLQTSLDRIRDVSVAGDEYQRWMIDDLYTLYLQRAVEACIDLANHLIAENGWETPKAAADGFEVLRDQGLLDTDFAQTLRSMVGFRNIAVHAYGSLNVEVVRKIVAEDLDDLRQFARLITERTVGN